MTSSGQEVGLEIWRIVKFKVERLSKEDYGRFFEGDSYIILNTYKWVKLSFFSLPMFLHQRRKKSLIRVRNRRDFEDDV